MKNTGRVALYPGSFNPFTKGHADIAERALTLFGNVVIAIGFNSAKETDNDITRRVKEIEDLYRECEGITVASYSGLTVDFARRIGADVMIRGVRDVKDFEYERSLADANRAISGLETVLFTTRPEYGFISSSLVRELQSYGRDVAEFLPENSENRKKPK